MNFPNYLETSNPFNLATPPAWFLAELYAYDPRIVIFPSTCKPTYQIGERGRFGHGLLRPIAGLPDTKIFAEHRLWPWKQILPTGVSGMSWARVLAELPEYDTQRYDDPAGQLDRMEAEVERANDRAFEAECDARSGAFYRTLGLIEGSRVGSGARPEGAYNPLGKKPRARRRRAYRPTGAGAGAMFVGR